MLFLILLGLILRLTWINKPEGLWNDEYVSWYISSIPFNDGFLQEVFKQCHMPLYYLFLKPFANCPDIFLRLTSVIPGVLAIPVMYFVGKEFSKKTALYASAITTVLSFLIYYSQEVRFYSLLFLFSALSLLFTIRLIKNSTKFNLSGYILSFILILFTHVLGIIYCFFNLLYLIYKRKHLSKLMIKVFCICIIIIIPIGLHILKMVPSSQWWGKFTYTNILFLFSDFFSPILTNNINAPPIFFYNKNLSIWMTVPTIIGLIGVCYSRLKGLLAVAFSTVFVIALISISGQLVFITKYSIEILPILILAVAVGFSKMQKIGVLLFTFFLSFHLAAIFTPYYVTKLIRYEGNNIPATIINLRKPDIVIYTYYEPERFKRYQTFKPQRTYYISKINRFDYKNHPEKILNNIKNGETVSVVFLDSVSFFNNEIYEYNKNNKKIPEMFLTFSNVKNKISQSLISEYSQVKIDTLGSWTVITAKKTR